MRLHPSRRSTLALAAVAVLVCTTARAEGQVLNGRVIGVRDGDSLVLLVDRKEIQIRLAEVDAPESGQPWGKRSKQDLSALVFGKTVEAEVIDQDRYGRSVARVVADGVDVSSEMVRRGSAWVYRQYAKREELYDLENAAREGRVGLWNLPEADRTPPWEWRHAGRGTTRLGFPEGAVAPPPPIELAPDRAAAAPETLIPAAEGFVCGTKRYCRDMVSCAEARFHLRECGLTRLDGDGDGRPCEKICGR